MNQQRPILSLKALIEAFEKSDKVTLSKFEFDSLMEVVEPALAASSELSMLRMEIKRIRKVATPAWKACERVSNQMARSGCKADERKIREWKFILDDARVVYWSDLPQRLRHRWREFTGL